MVERPNTVSGLIEKRRQIAGKIEHHQAELRQLIIDLDNLDHTIRLFDPDIDLEAFRPKPLPPRNQAYKGEVSRIVLAVLKRGPMTCQQLTQHVMAERGLNTADNRLVRTMSKRVGSCLRNQRRKGLVRSEPRAGQHQLWEIPSQ
jgi:hypothetical protein